MAKKLLAILISVLLIIQGMCLVGNAAAIGEVVASGTMGTDNAATLNNLEVLDPGYSYPNFYEFTTRTDKPLILNVTVPENAVYDVEIIGGLQSDNNRTLRIYLDGDDFTIVSSNAMTNGTYDAWETTSTTCSGLVLTKGKHTIKFVITGGSVKVKSIKFKKSGVYVYDFPINGSTIDGSSAATTTGDGYVAVEEGDIINYVVKGENTGKDIEVDEANYSLSVSYGAKSSNAIINLWVNDVNYGEFVAPKNGGWASTGTSILSVTTVKLKEGDVISFRDKAEDDSTYSINNISIREIAEPTVALQNGEGKNISALANGTVTARVSLPDDMNTKTVKPIFAIYRDMGDTHSLYKYATVDAVTAGAAQTFELPITDIDVSDGATYTYKAFFLDGVVNCTPYYAAVSE